MKDKIIIIGGGVHSKVVIATIKKNNNYEILGYTDKKDNGEILGIKYLGDDSLLPDIIRNEKNCKAALGIGSVTISGMRMEVFEKIRQMGFDFPPIISSTSIINEDVRIGEGTFINDRVIINSGSVIGKATIINTGAIVEHDCFIGDFVHIGPGAVLGGGVNIKENCFIGLGANIIQYIKVRSNCLIGAGSVVVKDITEQGIYYGVPAKEKQN